MSDQGSAEQTRVAAGLAAGSAAGFTADWAAGHMARLADGVPAQVTQRLRTAGLDPDAVTRLVVAALVEDLGGGTDATTEATVAADATGTGRLVAREDGVVAGLPVAELVFHLAAVLPAAFGGGTAADSTASIDAGGTDGAVADRGGADRGGADRGGAGPGGAGGGGAGGGCGGAGGGGRGTQPLRIIYHAADGERVRRGQPLLTVSGGLRALLLAERSALNLLCHLSGVATLTRRWVDEVAGTGAVIRDTRKTLPALRAVQKYAVRCGGGLNHRMSLADAVLVKDNHVAAAGSVAAAYAAAVAAARGLPAEIECDTLAQVAEVAGLGAEVILLDNFSTAELAQAVAMVAGRARLEASGGLSLPQARAVAGTGVDFLAVGALTHSAPALDIGLDLAPGEVGT
jgi:nicotinate-nucleotide pyrophosphorylase (carboxylating)